MKKLLLIAAMAALAIGASADGYKLEKVWELDPNAMGIVSANVRQGFGMNGKFYLNDKNVAEGAVPTIYEIDENGFTGVTFPGGMNCGITRDQAGNIVVSNAAFPAAWTEAEIFVIDPATRNTKTFVVPQECGLQGRCDFLGFAKGNMMEDGVLYLTGRSNADVNTDGIAVFTISGGEVDMDNCYLATCSDIGAAQRDNMTVINYYEDINGEPSLLYVYRSMGGSVKKLAYDGDNFTATTIVLPNKGATCGTYPFIFDGKEFYIYPQLPNYQDAWAIAEANAEEPIFAFPSTIASGNMNAFQGHWFNTEVDANGVTIYQYAPNKSIAVWRLTKDEPVPEIPNVYMLGGDDQPWDATYGTPFDYDAENNVYTATITFPAEYNYFGFTTELAENNDEGGWNYIEPFRFGAVADEGTDFWYEGQDFVSLTWDEYHAIRIAGGKYKLTINLDELKLFIENTYLRGDVNRDKTVSIGDVTELIKALLRQDFTESENFSPDNANCNLDDAISIADVTTLIRYLLSKNWPE